MINEYFEIFITSTIYGIGFGAISSLIGLAVNGIVRLYKESIKN